MNFPIGNTKKCQSIELQSSWYDYLEYGYIDWLGIQTMKMASISLPNHDITRNQAPLSPPNHDIPRHLWFTLDIG